jgi:MFS transporter, ACS family, tartrate transporter
MAAPCLKGGTFPARPRAGRRRRFRDTKCRMPQGSEAAAGAGETALDRARRKAYRRLLPLCFISYVIAYVDRSNVAIAKLTMARDLPGFDNAVIGFGAGIFFLGYFLLEIPGTLIVERWSARKWIARIMITWGITAALTAAVKTPTHFYILRFMLGLAEAGFYPGVIVYLTHWFASRDRARALAYFFVATPVAQIISPKISNLLLKIGTTEVVGGVTVIHPQVLGLQGWQWIYIAWGLPAVILGVVVLLALTDRPEQANWLTAEERDALLAELAREKAERPASHKVSLLAALRQPRVLVLAAIFFLIVTGSYGVEFFMPSILERWYALKFDALTWLVILPPTLALAGQLFVGWSSDRYRERWYHTAVPIAFAALGLAIVAVSRGNLPLTVFGFMVSYAGFKAYLPAFWSLPSLFLTDTAAAGCIGFINSVGNLGGFMGPFVLGKVEKVTGSFMGGIVFLIVCMILSSLTVFGLGAASRRTDS